MLVDELCQPFTFVPIITRPRIGGVEELQSIFDKGVRRIL
jgi:hypothetical protein